MTAAPLAHTETAAESDAPARFVDRLRQSLADDSFVRLVLGRPQGNEPSLQKLLARRIVLRGAEQLSLVWRHQTKDITKNLPLDEALALIASLLADSFRHAHLVTRGHDIQLALGKKGRWGLRIGKLAAAAATAGNAADADDADAGADGKPLAAALAACRAWGVDSENRPQRGQFLPDLQPHSPAMGQKDGEKWTAAVDSQPTLPKPDRLLAHDRARQHALALNTPFLTELGVTDAQHRLVPAMARKWRQINKFVEILGHAISQSPLAGRDPALPVRVLDFGAGKGYLTFAVHHHLQAIGRAPEVTGVEQRQELSTLCNQAVARLGLNGLHFECGDVRQHAAAASDIMIALHACDIATDVAMHRGITSGAAIILCSPCCHQQLRPQMHSPALLQPMLRHGIHMAEQAEMLTDTLRALLLQSAGYEAQVFEFISPEHTSKNKMVLAVRRDRPLPEPRRLALLAQVAELKAFYGVREQMLESLLAADAASLPVANAAAQA